MWKYRWTFTVILFFGIHALSMAQDRIWGKVLAEDGTSLFGVSVLALSAIDSSYIAGAATDTSGSFSISHLKPVNCIVSFSLMGYKKRYINVAVDFQSGNRPVNVVLEEEGQLLQGVTVTAQRDAFTYDGGKMTVDLSSAISGTDGTMLDALRKIPGVLIQPDGTILLNGQAGANIMIDNKLTYLSGENLVNYLRSIPVASIDKVELITQPSSRYDAVGTSGLINLQRKKKQEQGLNFIVNSSFEQGKKFRNNQSVAFTLNHKRTNLYADYSMNKGCNFIDITSARFYSPGTRMNFPGFTLDMVADRQQLNESRYVKSGIDYAFSKKLNAGVFVSANWFTRHKQEQVISDFYRPTGTSDSSLYTDNVQFFSHRNVSAGATVDYQITSRLTWDASVNLQVLRQGDDLDQRSTLRTMSETLVPDTLKGSTMGTIDIHTGQTNLVYDATDNMKVSAGLKSATVQINSDVQYNHIADGHVEEDNRLSSGFRYREQINAAYLQMNNTWTSGFSVDLGLRLEHTRMSGRYIISNRDSTLHRNYANLFFTFQTKYKISDNHQLFFQYGRRIVRPNYRDLNPFIEVNDRYLQEKGNTRLNAELIDNFEASWLIKQKLSVSMFYLNRNNPITRSFLLEDSSYTTTVLPMNLSGSYAAGLRINMNNLEPFRFWTIHLNASLTYKRFHWQEFDSFYTNTFLTPAVQVTNQLSFPQNWSVEVTGFYTGKMAEGQARIGTLSNVSLGVRKNMFSEKLGLYVYASDIFLTNRPGMTINNFFMQGQYKERRDSRMIGITLTYRFSADKPAKEIRRSAGSEEEKRVTIP